MVLIPGARVRSVTSTPDGIVVAVARRARRLRCPCGSSTPSCYDRSTRRWRHLDACGHRVFIEAEIRRLSCPACRRVRTEVVPWARPRARHTRAFEDLCAWLAQRTDRTTVARMQRCSWEAVSAIIERVVADHRPVLGELRRIGVDEIRYRRRTFLTLVVDHDTGRVVWIGEGRRAETLAAFYRELGALAQNIEAVTCDLAEAYVAATRRHAPQARICFDPFHVIALANGAIEQARRHAGRLDARSRRRRHLRWALLKGDAALTAAQRSELDELRRERHMLWRAWVLKEELRALYSLADPMLAANYLRTWLSRAARSRIPHMVSFARRLRAHFDGVVAAVELGLSNSRLEGTNSKIRLINHRGYGHHSASALASMIHLCCGGLTLRLPLR
jgi:transposase